VPQPLFQFLLFKVALFIFEVIIHLKEIEVVLYLDEIEKSTHAGNVTTRQPQKVI
jgi:hypothetical protein